jgi:hypothetical protein
MSLTMTCDRPGIGENGTSVNEGMQVEYLGHVPGGMVRVRFADGTVDIVHPNCFHCLRPRNHPVTDPLHVRLQRLLASWEARRDPLVKWSETATTQADANLALGKLIELEDRIRDLRELIDATPQGTTQ